VPYRSPSIAPRVIFDLLAAGASVVHLWGLSLYLEENPIDIENYLRSQQGRFVGSSHFGGLSWSCRAHASHDLFGQFHLYERLGRSARVSFPSHLVKILALGVEQYAEALESRYGIWEAPRLGTKSLGS
jgi:hypothetical protein